MSNSLIFVGFICSPKLSMEGIVLGGANSMEGTSICVTPIPGGLFFLAYEESVGRHAYAELKMASASKKWMRKHVSNLNSFQVFHVCNLTQMV
ncbi:hypothetical protein C5167_041992 [Papaver somniferum]|nr:hypothetical protein C5167_041992 [Papaver somniferum]